MSEDIETSNTDSLLKSLANLRKRCNEFNDIKQNVKEMNNILKDDLFLNIGSFAVMLREKIEQFSNEIKQILKLSHKSINENQLNFVSKLNDIENEIQQKKIEFKLTNLKNQSVDDFNKQLNISVKSKLLEIESELSKCDIHALYPNINYSVSSKKLMDSINSLKIDIVDTKNNEFIISNLEKRLGNLKNVNKNDSIDCVVTSGLYDNGTFWIKIVDNQVNFIIDEINKYIRYKRISDSTWLTFSEVNKTPVVGENCFCLDSKTHKWMRGSIESFDKDTIQCQIRYLDTSYVEDKVDFENLLEWKDFDLNNIQFKAFKCCLFNPIVDVDIKYSYNLKFLFKDLVLNKNLKCFLKDVLNDGLWLVDLYELDENNNNNQNESINNKLREELVLKKTFASEDIRMKDVNFVVNEVLQSILSAIEKEEKISNVKLPEIKYQEDVYIDDQSDENRLHSERLGMGYVTGTLMNKFVFWLYPIVDLEIHKINDSIPSIIADFIKKNRCKSFFELNIKPRIGVKCFARLQNSKFGPDDYRRAYIEGEENCTKKYIVRLVDRGCLIYVTSKILYPYKEIDGISNMKFRAIRCTLAANSNKYDKQTNEKFRKYFAGHQNAFKFTLVEQVFCNGVKCWYTEMITEEDVFLNKMLLESTDIEDIQLKNNKELLLRNKQERIKKSQSHGNDYYRGIGEKNLNRQSLHVDEDFGYLKNVKPKRQSLHVDEDFSYMKNVNPQRHEHVNQQHYNIDDDNDSPFPSHYEPQQQYQHQHKQGCRQSEIYNNQYQEQGRYQQNYDDYNQKSGQYEPVQTKCYYNSNQRHYEQLYELHHRPKNNQELQKSGGDYDQQQIFDKNSRQCQPQDNQYGNNNKYNNNPVSSVVSKKTFSNQQQPQFYHQLERDDYQQYPQQPQFNHQFDRENYQKYPQQQKNCRQNYDNSEKQFNLNQKQHGTFCQNSRHGSNQQQNSIYAPRGNVYQKKNETENDPEWV
jgi:hypothetical protein